jgi:hypothetical protein
MKKTIVFNGIIVGEYESTGSLDEDISAVRSYLKQKGLWKPVSVDDSMFGQANTFAQTAILLYRRDFSKSPYKASTMGPLVVNAVFSIEIYLKSIHEAYGNLPRGHDLLRLYDKLKEEPKNIILSAASDVRPRYKLSDDVTILTCLKKLKDAFEKWRYLYEHERLTVEIQSIRFGMNTLFEASCRVRERRSQPSAAPDRR